MQDMWVQSLGWEDPRSRKWQPTPVFCLGNPMETGTCPATNSPWVRKELDTTEHHHHHMDSSLNLFPIHFLSTTYWIYIQSIKHPSLLSIINLFIRSMAQLRRQSHQQIYKKNHVNQHEGFLWATGQAQILYTVILFADHEEPVVFREWRKYHMSPHSLSQETMVPW